MRKTTDHLRPRLEGQLIKGDPQSLSKINIDPATRVMLETQALDIFTQCCNSGLPLRDALVAILISGMDWGVNSLKENKKAAKHEKRV